MKAMILAAGFGERLRPLTETTPKPLLKVGGKPLIQYHVENLASSGIRELVINTAWLGDQIEAFLGNGSAFGVDIVWSREREPLETGGGICRALPLLGSEPFLLINGDVWSDYPLIDLVKKLDLVEKREPKDNLAHLVLVPNPEHNPDGDYHLETTLDGSSEFRNNQQQISYPKQGDQTFTFSGMSIMRPEIFSEYSSVNEKFPLRNVLVNYIDQGCVSGELFQGAWWDIGTLERLQALDALMCRR